MKKVTTLLSTLALATTLAAQNLPQTERQYLSGHGCDDMVEWDFFCTNGRNSGKWTKTGKSILPWNAINNLLGKTLSITFFLQSAYPVISRRRCR